MAAIREAAVEVDKDPVDFHLDGYLSVSQPKDQCYSFQGTMLNRVFLDKGD